MTPKERFLNACLNKEVDRPPVWLMRQAGRYLPEYRAIKERHTTKEMMQTPEIASEITRQPVVSLGVDAAILYSDILLIPDAMGMGLGFSPGEGPVFEFAIRDCDSLNRLKTGDVNQRLDFVFKTIKLCLKKLPQDFPLIGFAGAPFTVACYMIAGGAKKGFSDVKTFAWTQPKVFHALMREITDATIAYLLEQVQAGVVAVQLFDTWAGLLSAHDYRELAKPYTGKIFRALRSAYIPSIHYAKESTHLLDEILDVSADVISVDERMALKTLRDRTKNQVAIQGNLDPDVLLSTPEIIRERVRKMLTSLDNPKKGYIVNLGHGIGPTTPVKNARCFVAAAKEFFR